MKAVLKHELSGYFHTMTAYIFCAVFLVFVGVGATIYNIQSSVSNFEYVLSFVCIGLIIIIPILTMKVLSEERKQKTDQLLYSLPLKMSNIVIGKYLALLIIFAVPCVIISFYPLIFSKFGDVYLPTSYGSILAFFIMGAALIAIGTFISSLTANQGVAAAIAIAIIFLNYYSVTLSEQFTSTALGSLIALFILYAILALIIYFITKEAYAGLIVGLILAIISIITYRIDSSKFESLVPNFMSKISLFDQFTTFVNGAFDLKSIIFYVSVIVLFLFLSVQALEKRRYN